MLVARSHFDSGCKCLLQETRDCFLCWRVKQLLLLCFVVRNVQRRKGRRKSRKERKRHAGKERGFHSWTLTSPNFILCTLVSHLFELQLSESQIFSYLNLNPPLKIMIFIDILLCIKWKVYPVTLYTNCIVSLTYPTFQL